jgi:hypothetical protein
MNNRTKFLTVLQNRGASDNIAPTVQVTMSRSVFTAGLTATVTFTFSEAPIGFTVADVTAANGSLSSFTATGDPLIYTATFTPTANVTDLTNVITVGTGWTDAAGNPPAGSTDSPNYTVDTNNYDFSVLSNGSLPSGLTGATWSITSGQAANTPTLGAELLTDGGLEANYTAGKCDTLTLTGTNTVAQSADVHGGSKAQELTPITASSLAFADIGSMSGKWLMFSGWGKKTAGTGQRSVMSRVFNAFPGPFAHERPWKDATYTQKIIVTKSFAATMRLLALSMSNVTTTNTVVIDDFSVKEITAAEMYATKTFASADATTRIYIDLSGGNGTVGIVARLDSTTNPQNYILVGVFTHSDSSGTELAYISLAKVVAGTLTVLIAATSLGALVVNGDYVELVCSGNDVSIWYNGVQKGTTQTVSDAGIVSNTKFGFFGAGGGKVNRFF